MTGYCNQCDEMLTQLSSALDSLQDMTDKHQLVSEKTRALNDACEVLVEEQVRMDGRRGEEGNGRGNGRRGRVEDGWKE